MLTQDKNPNSFQMRVRQLPCGFMGKFLYHALPLRKKIVTANLQLAFGKELNDADLKHLAQCFYDHLFSVLWENMTLSLMTEKQIAQKVKVIGFEHVTRVANEGKGALLLTGHFGNWELCPIAGIVHYPQYRGRLHILRRQLVNKWIEHILFNRFYRSGLNIIPKSQSLNQVLHAIQREDAVAFVMDQFARIGKEGIEAPFFGQPCGTFKSLAMVARTTGTKVIPCYGYRTSRGKYTMQFDEPLEWIAHPDPDTEIFLNTEKYNQTLERIIRQHPDQWLWLHRRWKSKPPPPPPTPAGTYLAPEVRPLNEGRGYCVAGKASTTMNIIFFGNALPIAQFLLQHPSIKVKAWVFEDPEDRESILQLTRPHQTPIYQIKTKDQIDFILDQHSPIDLGIVANFGIIFTPSQFTRAHHGFINIHPGLLPQQKGRHPIQSARAQKEPKFGVTLHRITQHVDSGPTLFTKEISDPAQSVSQTLTHIFTQSLPLLEHHLQSLLDS